MPICEDSSIAPDSTHTPSSPIIPEVKRAMRTYGRPRPAATSSDDPFETSLSLSVISSMSRDSTYKTAPADLREEIPPSSDPPHSQSRLDDEGVFSQQDASQKFEFSWKKRLKDMDEEDVIDPAGAADVENASRAYPGYNRDLSLQRMNDEHKHAPQSRMTSPAESDVQSNYVSRVSLENPTSSSPTSRKLLPNTSPERTLIHDPGPAPREKKESSPASPSSPNPLSSPKHGSSPTPPTSDDDLPKISSLKGKSKASVHNRTHIPPLLFLPESSPKLVSTKLQGLSKSRRTKQKAVKALTINEKREIARSRMRMAADQQASIPKSEGSRVDFSLPGFFERLISSHRETDTDPIMDFSSDTAVSHAVPSPSTLHQSGDSPPQQRSEYTQKASMKTRALPEPGSNEDLPDVGALLDEEKNKQAETSAKLIARKLRILEEQRTQSSSHQNDDYDNDDDIQVLYTSHEKDNKAAAAAIIPIQRKRNLDAPTKILSLRRAGTRARAAKKESPEHDKTLKTLLPQKGEKNEVQWTLRKLNRFLYSTVQREARNIAEAKEDEFKQRGGRVKYQDELTTTSSVQEINKIYATRGKSLPDNTARREMSNDSDADDDDDDWAPENDEGLADCSPEPEGDPSRELGQEEFQNEEDITIVNEESVNLTDDEGMETIPLKSFSRRLHKQVIDSDDESELGEEDGVPLPHKLASQASQRQSNTLVIPKSTALSHRGSLSSMDDPTEDEGDKENETSRMWDRGEDKENKAVVRYAVVDASEPSLTMEGSLFHQEHGSAQYSSSLKRPNGNFKAADGGNEENYQPLDVDPFASPTRSKLPNSFETRLKLVSPATSLPSAVPLALTPIFNNRSSAFSQFPDDEHPSSSPTAVSLQPSFSDLFESGTAVPKEPPDGSATLSHGSFAESNFGLTQDLNLQPAFEVSKSLLRKADQIFEKEQEYVLEAATRKAHYEPELYVNDHGFLTQTRPDVPSPEVYKPSPKGALDRSYESQPSRLPLRTISLSKEVDFESPTHLNRLRKRETTPTSLATNAPYKSSPLPSPTYATKSENAFEVLKRGVELLYKEKPKQKFEESEFVEHEAQESDDDEMFGFGATKRDDDEEGEEDLDRPLETLVDDKEMDEKTVAHEKVYEKFQEQIEADDLQNEKLHQAAVQGELRKRRRNRGALVDDSDDSDEDETNARIRRVMHKKQRVDRENIKQLGDNEETKAFYHVYESGLTIDEGEFSYLKNEQTQGIDLNDDRREQSAEEELHGFITTREVLERVREVAENVNEMDEVPPDFHDVSWIEEAGNQSEEDQLLVKSVGKKKRQYRVTRPIEHLEFAPEMAHHEPLMPEESISRMQSWAKAEARSRLQGSTGRNVGGTAVTGHKAKFGGGSLWKKSSAEISASNHSKPSEPRRTVTAQPSVLQKVATERISRFR